MSLHLLIIGGEDHRLRIPFILALRKMGYRVTAAASGDPAPFAKAGIDYHRFHFDRSLSPLSDWRALKSLSRILDDVDADIAHSHDTKVNVLVPYAAFSGRRTRIIRTINGLGWVFSSRSPEALALRAAYPVLQWLAAKSTVATVFEHWGDCAYFERHHLMGAGETVIIPGAGIDVNGFEMARLLGPPASRLREELGLVGAEVVITVTRVTRQKGIPTLLKAAALVHAQRPSVKFLVVGPRESEGPFGVSDAEIRQHADYVILTGPRTDVPSLLEMADIFAFPSEYAEGVPRALMEAALAGLPIVATDIPGCREVIHDGCSGHLVPQHDPRALATRILGLLADRQQAAHIACRGPALMRTEFSLQRVVERCAELYERHCPSPRHFERPYSGQQSARSIESVG